MLGITVKVAKRYTASRSMDPGEQEAHMMGLIDGFNDYAAVNKRYPLTVENVIIAPNTGVTGTRDLPAGATEWGDYSRITAHFPKTYTGSLRNCIVEVNGIKYEVEGDPQPFMDDLVPGDWNRPVSLKRVDGGARGEHE